MQIEYALYKKGERHICSCGFVNDEGRIIDRSFGRDLLSEFLEKTTSPDETGWMIVTLDYACELINKLDDEMCGNYERITKEKWWDALEVLPPENWRKVNGAEIFRIMEYYTSNITSHYIRVGDNHYTVMHRNTKPYTEIAEEVSKLINKSKS